MYFVNPKNLKLPANGFVCVSCGLVQEYENRKCVFCGAELGVTAAAARRLNLDVMFPRKGQSLGSIMNFPAAIESFVEFARRNDLEIYNESALQFELSFYLREALGKDCKIQLERNISYLSLRTDLVKKEIDILVFSDIVSLSDVIVVELKAIIDQKIARPISVFNWITDMKFLEQLKSAGVGNCYSLFVTDNEKLLSESTISKSNTTLRLLPDFRKRKIHGTYSTHSTPNKKIKTISLDSEYTFQWKKFVNGQRYFLIEV
jgi:hypothetical protein